MIETDHRSTPKFRRVTGSLNAKFLQGINRDKTISSAQRTDRRRGSGAGLLQKCSWSNAHVCAHAVNHKVIGVRALPVNAELSWFVALSYR